MRYRTALSGISLLVALFICCSGNPVKWIQVEVRPWVRNDTSVQWEIRPTRILNGADCLGSVTGNRRTKYGSDESVRHEATGFFYTKRVNGRWWFVDPEGYRHINTSVVGVKMGPGDRNKEAFHAKFTDATDWMSKSAALLNAYGFYGTGPWSDDSSIIKYNNASPDKQLSRTVALNFMSRYGDKRGGTYRKPGNIGYPNECIFVFDPEFEAFCEREAAERLVPFRDDPTLLGYFSDNELPFGKKNLEGYLTLPDPEDHGRIAAENWMRERGLTRDGITDKERCEFAGYVAGRYYRIVARAIKEADPNHLYLGSRLHAGAKFLKEVVGAAGEYCDVVSVNYYGGWSPSRESMKNWDTWTNKPFLVTEFYTKAMDAGLDNITGAGFTVRTQQDRGYAYQHFTLALLKAKNCVGWHWFKYIDNDPSAKGVDPSNLNSNKGLVDNGYEPYLPLADRMKELNMNIYRLADYFDRPDDDPVNME